MNEYIYRVYGAKKRKGYELLKITTEEAKALFYINDIKYEKILIIRHNKTRNMDEPYILSFPNVNNEMVLKRIIN